MPNECYTYFMISGYFDPDDVTRQLSLQPDEVWYDRTGRLSEWKFGRCDDYSPYVEEQMRKTLAPLLDRIDVLTRLRQEYSAECWLVVVPTVYPDEPTPCLAPPLDVIDFCHATRTQIDIDLYMGVD